MELINLKVRHKTLGTGTILEFDGKYVNVQFASKTSKFIYPSAFETFIKAEDGEVQAEIDSLISALKTAEAEKKVAEEAALKAEMECKQAATKKPTRAPKKKATKAIKMDDMFSEDYHPMHLARQPIFTYQQVEEKFGIKISSFGRSVNPTVSSVVLISSISKAQGNFVYHDKWTVDGDYIYSGEGKMGDQAMLKGNLAIKNAATDGKKIHLFVKFSPTEYYYQGVFELVDYTYEDEKDEIGHMRKEYKFRLKRMTE